MKEIFLFIFGPILSFLVFVKHLFIYNLRLNQNLSLKFKEYIENKKTLVLKEDRGSQDRDFLCYSMINKHPIKFEMSERLLQAGFGSSTDVVSYITCFRFSRKYILKLINKIDSEKKQDSIPVYLMQPWDSEKIGSINIPDRLEEPFIKESLYKSIDLEIKKLVSGNSKSNKVGFLLYGLPGNGKTWLIKHFALKYKLPINIFSLTQDYNNHKIIRAFGNIDKPCVILMEDFDSYFDGRAPTDKQAQYTLDSILNVIDGVYNSYSNVVFFMTANNIDRIDTAIKDRPGRFRIVENIGCPDEQTICKIMGPGDNSKYVGKTLDQILKEKYKLNYND